MRLRIVELTSFFVFEGPKLNQYEGPLVFTDAARFDRSGMDPPVALLDGRFGIVVLSDKEALDLFSSRG